MVEISTGLVTKVWNKNPKHMVFVNMMKMICKVSAGLQTTGAQCFQIPNQYNPDTSVFPLTAPICYCHFGNNKHEIEFFFFFFFYSVT